MLEKDPEWPGRFFNTSFIIDPQGEIILKHWKHNHNAFLLPYTSPCDVYDEFVRVATVAKPFSRWWIPRWADSEF